MARPLRSKEHGGPLGAMFLSSKLGAAGHKALDVSSLKRSPTENVTRENGGLGRGPTEGFMSKEEAAVIDEKVIAALRGSGKAAEPRVLIEELRQAAGLDELKIRAAIWRLIAHNTIELSGDRKLTLPRPSFAASARA